MNTTDKIPPNSPESELALLGCVIQDPTIAPESHRDWFYDLRHRNLFDIISGMVCEGKPVDQFTLTQAALKVGIDTNIIGEALDAAPSAANAQYWADELRAYEMRRHLIRLATDTAAQAYKPDCVASELIDAFERDALTVRRGLGGTSEADLTLVARELVDDYEAAMETKHHRGLETGFYGLDRLLCGLRSGQLIILAARPSVGKTSLALNVAEHSILKGIPVGVFSLEMTAKELFHRMTCSLAKVDGEGLLGGRVNEAQVASIVTAQGRIRQSPLHIHDRGGITVAQVVAQGRRMVHKHGIKLLIVDYLGLIRSGEKGRSRYEDTSLISASLKTVAKDLGIPVVCLAQLNRDSEKEDRSPRLSDLRDSGSIEQDADSVLLLHRKPDNSVQLIVAKNRSGRTGVVDLVFFPEYTRFENKAFDAN